MDYRIYPPEQLIEDGIADLPLSKSMLNRRMVIEALTPGCPEGSLLYSGTGGDGPEIRDIAVILGRSAADAVPGIEKSGRGSPLRGG